MDLLGAFFAGVLLALFLTDSTVKSNNSKIKELKKENDKLRALGRLHIGQVVYACKTNSLYIGEITKIIHTSIRSRIELNDDEEFLQSEIYLTKDDALKQLEI